MANPQEGSQQGELPPAQGQQPSQANTKPVVGFVDNSRAFGSSATDRQAHTPDYRRDIDPYADNMGHSRY